MKRITVFMAALVLVLGIAAGATTSFAQDGSMKQTDMMTTKKPMMKKHRMTKKHRMMKKHHRHHKHKMMKK